MKPFDLEQAKAGKPVCTRRGYRVRILCFDRKQSIYPEVNYPIVALVDTGVLVQNDEIRTYTATGQYITGHEDQLDLMMVEGGEQ